MKQEIKHRHTGEVIYSIEAETLKEAVEKAVKYGVSLRYADLSNSDLSNYDLSHSDLRNSDLRGSGLRNSGLRGSDLRGSDLRNSDLRGSDLRYSNLRGSDLRGSDLRYSDLRGSDLRYSNLRGTCFMSFRYRNHEAICTEKRLTIGCKDMPLAQWASEYEEIGKKYGYSDFEIQMYGKFIEMCVEATNNE